ncbi:hypothetical protein AX15_003807 [Amanita polypyramis BW_CC]|nr:hypothetical protein AX15_003807 [Amanita polypyramis BW_CC]
MRPTCNFLLRQRTTVPSLSVGRSTANHPGHRDLRGSLLSFAFSPPHWTGAFRTCHYGPPNKDLQDLFRGNQEYRGYMAMHYPQLLENLAKEGQFPPFAVFQCADSRLSEQAIFNTTPGTIFAARNIANVFTEDDITSTSVLGFAVEKLGVRHIIVMGHYGCGGVAASMVPPSEPPLSPADAAISTWISPIRKLFATSTRPEIVTYRQQLANGTAEPKIPELHNPAFRALIEENVKMSVRRIAESEIMRKNYATYASDAGTGNQARPEPIFIHGWVKDIENGIVSDLGVSTGPPGVRVPLSPFPTVAVE